MHVRDAVERDAPAMAGLTDAPESVLRNLVHDRSVRVLLEGEAGDADDAALLGFVSFDAREDAVHVTEFGGDRTACERLLEEPIGFAEREGLAVELLLPEGSAARDDDAPMRAAVEDAGFSEVGAGPRFRGTPTRRYRYDSGDTGR